jgi:hypothetical protein
MLEKDYDVALYKKFKVQSLVKYRYNQNHHVKRHNEVADPFQ